MLRAATCVLLAFALDGQETAPAPVKLTAQQDHQRLLEQLHISSLRPGADPSDSQAINHANYDESLANPFPVLPDPSVLKSGKRVTSAALWVQRRKEIIADFDSEIYGQVPANVPRIYWEQESQKDEVENGIPVLIKNLIGHVNHSAYPPISVDIKVSLVTPVKAAGKLPILLALGGGRSTYDDASFRRTRIREILVGHSWQSAILAKGWGYATLSVLSVQQDSAEGLTAGIIGLVNKGQPRKPEDWGVLRAWAWGASRALDYLQTEQAVDAQQIGIWGELKFARAAILALAYDERFAIGFVSEPGLGGAKLYRRNYGERVENLASPVEYYRMAGNFLKYAGPLTPNDLPVDSNELIALCAPRPLFISASPTSTEWNDPKGMFLAAQAASPVYELLGAKGLPKSNEYQQINQALLSSDLAFYGLQDHDACADSQLAERKAMLQKNPGSGVAIASCRTDSAQFLRFASRYLKDAATLECGFKCMGLVKP